MSSALPLSAGGVQFTTTLLHVKLDIDISDWAGSWSGEYNIVTIILTRQILSFHHLLEKCLSFSNITSSYCVLVVDC